jgi:hypothetical protein
MREFEQYKRPSGLLKNIGFILEHDATPNIVERTRTICLINQVELRMFVESGLVTPEKLQKIEDDKDIQEKYNNILKDARNGKNDVGLLPDFETEELAGWFIFFRDFHEKLWKIKLLTEEERKL